MEILTPPKKNKKTFKKIAKYTGLVLCGVVVFVAITFSINPNNIKYFLGSLINWGTGTTTPVDPVNTDHYAYSENLGWIDFTPTTGEGVSVGDVILYDVGLTGYAYSANAGWIKLDADGIAGAPAAASQTETDWGVVNDGEGNLSGYAYGENIGWIDFNPQYGGTDYGVVVDENSNFSGWAYSANAGWISFNCLTSGDCDTNPYKVVTDGQSYTQVTTTLTIQTQPANDGCYSNVFSTQPVIVAKDQYGNNMESVVAITASRSTGTGTLSGTLSANTSSGVASFTNLRYNKEEQFKITFTAGSVTVISGFVAQANPFCGGAGGAPGVPYYSITASAGVNGSITPSGLEYFPSGTTKEYIITPNAGYKVEDVLVNNVSVGALNKYTFVNVTSGHTISATFSAIDTTASVIPPVTPPVTPPVVGQPATKAEILDYVSSALNKIKIFLSQGSPSLIQPTTPPPSGLQPALPPSGQTPTTPAVNNQGAVILLMEKLLTALKSLLGLVK